MEMLELIKAGANSHGLRLIGGPLIGFKFVPAGDMATAANFLLDQALDGGGYEADTWLEQNRDGEYNHADWTERADAGDGE